MATLQVQYDARNAAIKRLVHSLMESGVFMPLPQRRKVRKSRIDEADEDKPETFVPLIYTGAQSAPIATGNIAIGPQVDNPSYTVVTSYDLEKGIVPFSVFVPPIAGNRKATFTFRMGEAFGQVVEDSLYRSAAQGTRSDSDGRDGDNIDNAGR